MEKAIDYLREKGLSAAAKKSGRIAAEGGEELIEQIEKEGFAGFEEDRG